MDTAVRMGVMPPLLPGDGHHTDSKVLATRWRTQLLQEAYPNKDQGSLSLFRQRSTEVSKPL